MKLKTEDVYKDFSSNKEMFDSSNYSTKSKYYNDLNKLAINKLKDKITGVLVEEFPGLKPEIYPVTVDDNSEHVKGKCLKRNVVQKITCN